MTDTIHILLIVCPLVFLAGFIDAIAGGGGLISLPAYLAAGIPPHFAAATNKCSSTFGTLVATGKFLKSGKVNLKAALPAAGAALIGSSIGAYLNMLMNEQILRYIMIGTVPVIAVFLMVKKDFGSEDTTDKFSKTKIVVLSAVIGFTIGMYDGFFGPGTGTFLIIAFTGIVGFDLLTASGNTKVVNLASNIAAFITFAIGGKIIWHIGIPAAVFGIAGNYLGATFALKKGTKFIRPMFFVVLSILIIKLIFDMMG